MSVLKLPNAADVAGWPTPAASPAVIAQTEQIIAAAKWNVIHDLLQRRGFAAEIAKDGVAATIMRLANAAGHFKGLVDTCRECGMTDDAPNTFIGSLAFKLEDIEKACRDHGKPKAQPVTEFIREMAKNLEHETGKVYDVADVCGYDGENGQTLAEFVRDAISQPCEVVEPTYQFNDCKFQIAIVNN